MSEGIKMPVKVSSCMRDLNSIGMDSSVKLSATRSLEGWRQAVSKFMKITIEDRMKSSNAAEFEIEDC